MDISTSLADVTHSTMFWDVRYLTEEEKNLYRVNGTDRATSEILFKEISFERKITKEELKKIFNSQYSKCFNEMKYLKQTAWDCVRTRNYVQPWFEMTVASIKYVYEGLKELVISK
jgi:hypothetical protein